MAAGSVTQRAQPFRWDLLEEQPPTGARLTVRLADPSVRDDVFIGVDSARRRYVLVGIPNGEPQELAERPSRGIAVQTVEMQVGGDATAFFVEIACLESLGHAALDVVIGEIMQALDAGASIGRIRLVQNVLAKWRRFWSGVDQGLLPKEQQLGLFGEIWLLTRWLAPAIGAAKAVQLWRGPSGARNDFEMRGLGIEVKTTGRLDGAHLIHGLEQLLEPNDGALFLFSLVTRDESSGTESLPALIEAARAQLSDDFVALSLFDSNLYALGYEDRHSTQYGKLKLRIRNESLYRVQSGFPRLLPESIVGGVPPGIVSVNYELRLDGASPWLLATSPAAASTLLKGFIEH